MFPGGKQFLVLMLAGLMFLSGCKKKKPPVPQPQAQAPVVTETEPAPPPAPAEPEPAPPAVAETEPAATTPPPKPQTATKSKTPKPKANKKNGEKEKDKIVAKKTEPPLPPKPAPPPAETRPPDLGSLSVGTPHSESQHQRASTTQLLDSTEANLKSIRRTLSKEEENMLQQIKNYAHQSKDATAQGDTERAYNLALKAHLLSDELAKAR